MVYAHNTNAVPKGMEGSFVLPDAGQMPLACRVPLASRDVQIQLMDSYAVAYPGLVFRERVSVFSELCRWLRHRKVVAVPGSRFGIVAW